MALSPHDAQTDASRQLCAVIVLRDTFTDSGCEEHTA